MNSVRFARIEDDFFRANKVIYAILTIENNSNQFVRNMLLVLGPKSGLTFMANGSNGMKVTKSYPLSTSWFSKPLKENGFDMVIRGSEIMGGLIANNDLETDKYMKAYVIHVHSNKYTKFSYSNGKSLVGA